VHLAQFRIREMIPSTISSVPAIEPYDPRSDEGSMKRKGDAKESKGTRLTCLNPHKAKQEL